MEISPRELRDTEIREAFRGYHRDDVNELLERAAATIEALTTRVRELGDRLASATPAGAPNRSRDLEDMLERTLLLAKRTADEEVAEAQAKARQLVEDAEAKARKLVLDAEVDSRRRAEEERGKIQRQLADLSERRELLVTNVTDLERFEAEYRERLLRSIEADLAVISGRSEAAPGPVPEVAEVEVPPLPEGVASPAAGAASGPEAVVAADKSSTDERAAEQPAPAEPSDDATGNGAGNGAGDDAHTAALLEAAAAALAAQGSDDVAGEDEPTAALGIDAARAAPSTESPARQIDLLDEETIDAEVVDDDDVFFAQLREAVSDDREDTAEETSFFDQDVGGAKAGRDIFRRRR